MTQDRDNIQQSERGEALEQEALKLEPKQTQVWRPSGTTTGRSVKLQAQTVAKTVLVLQQPTLSQRNTSSTFENFDNYVVSIKPKQQCIQYFRCFLRTLVDT